MSDKSFEEEMKEKIEDYMSLRNDIEEVEVIIKIQGGHSYGFNIKWNREDG